MKKHKGWHSRGYLPHFDGGENVQMLTFRLADSLPKEVWERWSADLERRETCEKTRQRKLWAATENYLDRGMGSCLLREPQSGALVENSLLFFDGERYRLFSWVVMPNHVHVLLETWPGVLLEDVAHSWKSYTANQINQARGVSGALWQCDYFDRFIRNEKHLNRALAYIENNPVTAKLCARPEDWPFSSARRSARRSAGILPA